jgi:hypothetical protein
MLPVYETETRRPLHYRSAAAKIASDLQDMSAVNDRGWRGRPQCGRRSVVLNDSDYLSVSVNQYASHMQKFADIYIRRPSVC